MSLIEMTDDDRLEIAKNRSKLFARALHPSELTNFPNERWDVDFKGPVFEWKIDGKRTTWGPVQLIGSWASDGTWLWGWHNETVSTTAHEQIREAANELPELALLLEKRKLQKISYEEADELASWIAMKTGWLGAWPASNDQSGTAFLALKLKSPDAASFEPEDNLWCMLCGLTQAKVKGLMNLGNSFGVCDECAAKMAEGREMFPEDFGPDGSYIGKSTPQPCCACGENASGITMRWVHFCWECIAAMARAFTGK